MHDAQNLFDRYVSYAGEWEVDECMTALASEGLRGHRCCPTEYARTAWLGILPLSVREP
ncbi:MAG UNVERIFIED_CONTAM: hypothetical protein LVT10_13310 [Anaerolineae bacterium]